ncbi:MAG: S8 family serine peptidase [Candidatus Obscuribacterales bacterium]|nr:S8 family serine peptidase [Candidatus Obscuribacterales bacterium]
MNDKIEKQNRLERITGAGQKIATVAFLVSSIGLLSPLSALAQVSGAPAPSRGTEPGGPNIKPDQAILFINPKAKPLPLQKSLKKLGATKLDTMGNIWLVHVGSAEAAVALAPKDPNFLGAQVNHVYYPQQFTSKPNDPGFAYGQQSYLQQMNVPASWGEGAAGGGVKVGILDTGIDSNSPEMANRLADPGMNVPLKKIGGEETSTSFGHGTFVAALLGCATNNGKDFASPAFESGLIPVVVTDSTGNATEWNIVRGLRYIKKKGCAIANLSYNANPPNSISDPGPSFLHHALKHFGGLVFVAVGNGGMQDEKAEPREGLVPIGGVDPNSNPSSFSNYGSHVMFSAPAENINNTGIGGAVYVGASGTSFAAPLVAGIFAQLVAANPKQPLTTVLQLMQSTAKHPSGFDTTKYGAGIPDAGAAIAKSDIR